MINKRHQHLLPGMIKDYEAMISSDEERRTFTAFREQLARYAVAVGVALALLVSRCIIRPLGVGLQLAEAVAAGDLRSNVKVNGRDQLADLLRALQNMNHRLVDMVGGVRRSSEKIATGCAEIAIGNSDLSLPPVKTGKSAQDEQSWAAF